MALATAEQTGTPLLTRLTATGSTNADAYQLYGRGASHEFTTVPSGSGAILPVPRLPSGDVIVQNSGSNTLAVYPPVGGTINGQGMNVPFTLAAGAGVIFWAADLMVWYTIGGSGGSAYASPAFTAFAISGQSSPIEVGTTISGSQTFTWSTSNSGNVQANSIGIEDATTSTVLGSALANSGSAVCNVGTVSYSAPATETWQISGTNTHSATFSATFAVSWEWRVYAGSSANPTLTATQIQALTDSANLQSAFAGTYNINNASAVYYYLAFPTSMGAASSFVDGITGFPIGMATSSDNAAYDNTANGYSYAEVSVTNVNGDTTTYAVYRTQYTFRRSP